MEMFDENTFRIRRNLIALSTAVICFKLASDGIDLQETTAIFGIDLKGVKEPFIEPIMSVGLWYLMGHFLFSAWGKFLEWKLRLSGMKVGIPNQPTAQDLLMNPGAESQMQATLTGWWAAQYHETKNLDAFLPELKAMLEADSPIVNQKTIENKFSELSGYASEILKNQQYMKASLSQYEKGFKAMQQNQAQRWIIFEAGVPVILGLLAVVLIIYK